MGDDPTTSAPSTRDLTDGKFFTIVSTGVNAGKINWIVDPGTGPDATSPGDFESPVDVGIDGYNNTSSDGARDNLYSFFVKARDTVTGKVNFQAVSISSEQHSRKPRFLALTTDAHLERDELYTTRVGLVRHFWMSLAYLLQLSKA